MSKTPKEEILAKIKKTLALSLSGFIHKPNDERVIAEVIKVVLDRNRKILALIEEVLAQVPPTGKTQLDVFLERLKTIEGNSHENP